MGSAGWVSILDVYSYADNKAWSDIAENPRDNFHEN